MPQFLQRAGHYFQNWDSLLANWHKKVRATIAELEALDFETLPDVVPLEWITGGQRPRQYLRADGELRQGDPAASTRRGSTTSSS